MFDLSIGFEFILSTRPWEKANWGLFSEILQAADIYIPDSMTNISSPNSMQRSMPWTNAVPLLRDTSVTPIILGLHNGCGTFVPALNDSTNFSEETRPLPTYPNYPVPGLDTGRNAGDNGIACGANIWDGPLVLKLPVSSCASSSARKRRISPPSSTPTVYRPALGRTQRTCSSLPISHSPHLHTFCYMNTPMLPRR